MRTALAIVVATALLIPFTAAAQQDPPVIVPVVPVEPIPEPVPEPTPEEIAVDQRASAAFQLLLDTINMHDRGAEDMAEAETDRNDALGILARAEQHLTDVEAERQGSATTVVANARAAIAVLEAVILEYAPAQ